MLKYLSYFPKEYDKGILKIDFEIIAKDALYKSRSPNL